MAKIASILGLSGQKALGDGHAAVARALGVLIRRQDLDAGVLREHFLAALDAIDDRSDLRTVDDQHIAFAAGQMVDNVLAGERAGLDVVGHDGDVGALRADVEGRDDDAGLVGALDRRSDGLRVDGVEHDDIDAGGDEIVDLRRPAC